MGRRFTRTIEDFVCAHCGEEVKGNGYTNHCPACLWSRHVDVNPGDRANPCTGLMAPISIQVKGDHYIIEFRCQKCGEVRRNRASAEDDFNQILAISGGVA